MMLGDVSKVFGRDFAIAYFLPVAAFISVNLGLLELFSLSSDLLRLLQSDILLGATVCILLSWFGAVFLMTANRDIIRLLEGDGRFNPARILHRFQIRRFRKLRQRVSTLQELQETCDAHQMEFSVEDRVRLSELAQELSLKFPDEETWVLPTAFGNTIAAFEVYSRVMYGIDSITGWLRLLAVIPEDYRQLVNGAKARMSFWVNLWFLGIIVIVEYIAIVSLAGQLKALWVAALTFSVAVIAYWRACSSAAEWGGYVKSAFDVFLPELERKLGFPKPESKDEAMDQWQSFSIATGYVIPEYLPYTNDDLANKGK